MKKVRHVLGIILLVFNGIGVVSFFLSWKSFVKDGKLGIWIFLLLFFAVMAFIGYLLYSADRKNEARKPLGPAPEPVRAERAPGAEPEAAGTTASPAPAGSAGKPDIFKDTKSPEKPGKPESPEAGPVCTVIANYLELPFHDGDNFFLFKNPRDAEQFVRISRRNDLYVRRLESDIIKNELMEYLSCGYTGAVVKNDLSVIGICGSDRKLTAEDLVREYQLSGISRVGNVAPEAGRKMHNYLNQMSYTYRKYGKDMSAVPPHWQEHLKGFKSEVVRHLLLANLCLPAEKKEDGSATFSVLTAVMPSGQKWAAIFTDSFAIARYMRKTPTSIVFPNLVSDIAKGIRSGKIADVSGILINPGREEFKMTVDEIAADEAWLAERPDIHVAYSEKTRLPAGAGADPDARKAKDAAEVPTAKPETAEKKPAEPAALKTEPSPAKPESTEKASPKASAADTEPFEKIDLSVDREKASVTPARSFFVGLFPDEKRFDVSNPVSAGDCDPKTEGFIRLEVPGPVEYFYDPKYRRFLCDHYTRDYKSNPAVRLYQGRESILPLDLIDRINRFPEDRNPEKAEKVRKIQEIVRKETEI